MDDRYVVSRLKELLEWADYIVESLTVDQGHEAGKVASLKRLAGEPSLQDLRRTAWMLREKLYVVAVESEGRCAPRQTSDRVAKVG